MLGLGRFGERYGTPVIEEKRIGVLRKVTLFHLSNGRVRTRSVSRGISCLAGRMGGVPADGRNLGGLRVLDVHGIGKVSFHAVTAAWKASFFFSPRGEWRALARET